MPFGNGQGPAGQGPRTGRGLGYCSGYSSPGYTKSGFSGYSGWGRSLGWFGRGGGRGWRNWYYATGLPGWQRAGRGYYPQTSQQERDVLEQEKNMISEEVKALEQQMKDVEKRIKELKKK